MRAAVTAEGTAKTEIFILKEPTRLAPLGYENSNYRQWGPFFRTNTETLIGRNTAWPELLNCA